MYGAPLVFYEATLNQLDLHDLNGTCWSLSHHSSEISMTSSALAFRPAVFLCSAACLISACVYSSMMVFIMSKK